MPITLKFVDKIDAAPTTRLDLNDGTKWSFQRSPSPDFSPPPLKRAVVSTLMRQGAKIAASAYDNRVLKFDLVVQETTEDLLATELQKLNRELDRGNNILKYQPINATNPVYFRTFRSPGYGLRIDSEGVNRLRLSLEILAEPFAYGQMVEVTGITVNNDPAAGSNGLYFEVTGVTGDVPTPVLLLINEVDVAQGALAVRRHGTPAIYFRQAEALTQMTDTASGAEAGHSGGSRSSTSFATASMQTRLTGAFPLSSPTSSVEYRGTYRVFARVQKSVGGDDIRCRIKWAGNNLLVTGDTVTLGDTGTAQLVDLGLFTVPPFVDPIGGGYSNDPLAVQVDTIEFQAERVSGSGTLEWDYIVLLPADEELMLFDAGTATVVFDGPNDISYQGTLALVSGTAVVERAGSIPLLAPNQTNRLYLLRNVAGANVITDATDMILRYWPRHLYVRP